ncbi:hypothetical protein O4J56_09785 [Nocardiopsis sp. RSe5-2]|uniref:DUF4352 domain-containing protein n=1 Tax=Nocardiopsis endophytica TaxID=3018445 RepID=A0ABT4U1W4_9ACTN|nr:hypothetical protein [Nocardiopsis endophytica]MDA2810925.1 hypothetical protein [Nocardiopsis endophytica]
MPGPGGPAQGGPYGPPHDGAPYGGPQGSAAGGPPPGAPGGPGGPPPGPPGGPPHGGPKKKKGSGGLIVTLIAVPLVLVLVGGAAGVWFFTDIPFRMGIPGAVPRGGGGTLEGPRSVADFGVSPDWNGGDYTLSSMESSEAADLRTPGDAHEFLDGDLTVEVQAVEPLALDSSAVTPDMYATHPGLEDGFTAYALTFKLSNTTDRELDLIHMSDKAGAGDLMTEIPLLDESSDLWPTSLDPGSSAEIRRTYAVPTAYDYEAAVLEVRGPGTGPGPDDFRNDEEFPGFYGYWLLTLTSDTVTGPLGDDVPGREANGADDIDGLIEATDVWRAVSPSGRMLALHGTPLVMGIGTPTWNNDASTDDTDAFVVDYKVESPYKARSWEFAEAGFRVFYGDDMKEADLFTPDDAPPAPQRITAGQEWDGMVGFETPKGFEGPAIVEVTGPGTVNGEQPVRYWYVEV